jgi:hypothetical protein
MVNNDKVDGGINSKVDALKEQAASYGSCRETEQLIDELYKQEVLEARAMDPGVKFFLGQQLFEAACRITLAGIQHQFPEKSEAQRMEMLRERLELQRRLEGSP